MPPGRASAGTALVNARFVPSFIIGNRKRPAFRIDCDSQIRAGRRIGICRIEYGADHARPTLLHFGELAAILEDAETGFVDFQHFADIIACRSFALRCGGRRAIGQTPFAAQGDREGPVIRDGCCIAPRVRSGGVRRRSIRIRLDSSGRGGFNGRIRASLVSPDGEQATRPAKAIGARYSSGFINNLREMPWRLRSTVCAVPRSNQDDGQNQREGGMPGKASASISTFHSGRQSHAMPAMVAAGRASPKKRAWTAPTAS